MNIKFPCMGRNKYDSKCVNFVKSNSFFCNDHSSAKYCKAIDKYFDICCKYFESDLYKPDTPYNNFVYAFRTALRLYINSTEYASYRNKRNVIILSKIHNCGGSNILNHYSVTPQNNMSHYHTYSNVIVPTITPVLHNNNNSNIANANIVVDAIVIINTTSIRSAEEIPERNSNEKRKFDEYLTECVIESFTTVNKRTKF